MIEKVYRAVRQWNMLEGCSGVVVGFSGGADSVSLLHAMSVICAERGLMLRAVHVNHGIRGESAQRDESFCRSFCERFSVELDVFNYDIPALAKEQGIGLEECGRIYRYRCFDEISRKYGLRIATAHTLSDSAETVLLNIARGCGTAGLRGIPAVRGEIIRPLILASRDDIEQYCADNNLEYVTDETNFDDSFSRNRVRMNIIPQMKQLNSDFLGAVSRLTKSCAEDEKYLADEAEKALKAAEIAEGRWQAEKIYTLPDALRKRAVMRMIEKISGKSADFTHVEQTDAMVCGDSGAVSLPCGAVICVKNGIICKQSVAAERVEWSFPAAENIELPDGRIMTVSVMDCAEFVKLVQNNKILFKSAVNHDIIKNTDLVRCRRAGDSFAPSGRGVTKSIKKLFNEAKIDVSLRDDLVMIEHNGKLVWIEGFGAAEGFVPSGSAADNNAAHSSVSIISII